MKLLADMSFDQMVWEWLRAEWFKSHFDNIREQKNNLIVSPNFTDNSENEQRLSLLRIEREVVVMPLKNLQFTWKKAVIENRETLQGLFTIPFGSWFGITGRTFQLSEVVNHIQSGDNHVVDILKKKKQLLEKKAFPSVPILVGNDTSSYTIIEGNHRLSAVSLLSPEEFSPVEVVVGSSEYVNKYRWSISWEHIQDVFNLYTEEEESFVYTV